MRISDWSSDVCSSDLPMQHRHGLLEIDDVNAVPDAEEVRRDLRVPAAGVVTEVDAGLEELAHGEGGSNHLESFFRLNLRRPLRSEERRVGKEWFRTGRSRWWRCHLKKKKKRKE